MAERTRVTREVSQRDTHRFAPRLNIVARPVDTFDRSAGLSNDASRISEALGGIANLARTSGQVFELQNLEAAREGKRIAEEGEAAPEGTESIFRTGNIARKAFMESKAERELVDMLPEVSRIATEAENEEDFLARTQALGQASVDAFDGDEDFHRKFVPDFEEIVGRTQARLMSQWKAQIDADNLQDAGAVLQSRMKERLSGIAGGLTPQQLKANPEAYDQFQAQLLKDGPEVQQMLRGFLSTTQERLGHINIPKDQVSKWMLNQVRSLAIDYGAPELFDFTEIPDSGQKLSDLYPDAVRVAKASAQNVRDGLEASREKLTREYRQGIEETIMGDTLDN